MGQEHPEALITVDMERRVIFTVRLHMASSLLSMGTRGIMELGTLVGKTIRATSLEGVDLYDQEFYELYDRSDRLI